jgi:hypothetical protein
MDPELKKELQEIHVLVRDNHQMLRAIRRGQWYSFWSKIIFWGIVIVVPFLLYQHYLEPLLARFSPEALGPQSLISVPSTEEIKNLIESYLSGR